MRESTSKQFFCRLMVAALILSSAVLVSCSAGSSDAVSAAGRSSSADLSAIDTQNGVYLVGAGMYDVTGPVAEVGMMGFADDTQVAEGLQMRLRSRAYIVGDATNRVVFVNSDLWAVTQAVKQKVMEKIKNNAALSPYYNDKNVLLSATHTHSGVGGFSHYFLYNATTKGFISQNFDAIVNGIYQSIVLAHNNLQPGRIYINRGEADGFGFNRSIAAYNCNPESERARYASPINKTMTLIKLVGTDGTEIGMINWLGVHPTSVGPANKLLNPDNKGLAEYWFEKKQRYRLPCVKNICCFICAINCRRCFACIMGTCCYNV